jgi:hypothetical protein
MFIMGEKSSAKNRISSPMSIYAKTVDGNAIVWL